MHTSRILMLSMAISATLGLGGCLSAEEPAVKTGAATMEAQQGAVQDISNAQLQDLLDKGVTLVDIRLPEEWRETGIVEGSKPLTLFEKNGSVAPNFLANLQQMAPADKPVALICRTGNRTRAGAEMLRQVGYSQVYNVKSGITGWIREGKPVVRQ